MSILIAWRQSVAKWWQLKLDTSTWGGQIQWYRFWVSMISGCWKIANGILFRKQESALPPTRSVSVLAENFSEFFQTKIDNIIKKLWDKATDLDNRYIETNFQTNCRLKKFTPVLQSDLKEIVAFSTSEVMWIGPYTNIPVKNAHWSFGSHHM